MSGDAARVKALVKALRYELDARTNAAEANGSCEVCGGGYQGLPYHEGCCKESRAVLARAERWLKVQKADGKGQQCT